MENKKDLSRNKEQELIMFSIYDALVYVALNEEFSVEDIMSGVYNLPYEEIPYFSKEIVIKSLSHYAEIVEVIEANLRGWTFSRLNNVIKAILISSYTKVKYVENPVDKKIVIDLAVRLAKKYAEPTDYKFVNAILDNIL